MSARFATWLIGEGVLPEATILAASARQLVYGGALDTAILEMGVMTESALWARLGAATGLPVPTPALCEGQLAETPPSMGAARTGVLRTVPVAAKAGALKLLCSEPVAADEIQAAAIESGFTARLYVVPEVRLLAARHRVYGEPMPARYAPLLARILGAARTRRNHFARPPEATPLETAPTADGGATPLETAPTADVGATPLETAPTADVGATPLEQLLDLHLMGLSGPIAADSDLELDIGVVDPSGSPLRLEVPGPDHDSPDSGGHPATEALCRRARDSHDKGRALALRALRRRLAHPAALTLLGELRAAATGGQGDNAIEAINALGELRDETMIPALIRGLAPGTPPKLAEAIHRALVALAAQDHGRSRRRWQVWADRNTQRPRTEWLLDGLAHKEPHIRMAASEELRQLSGDSFGYLFDLPKRQREQARRKWMAWWKTWHEQPERP